MDSENISEYKKRLKTLQELIQESEDFLNEIGFKTPIEFPELENHEKIAFPSGYIRKRAEFETNYKLKTYLNNPNLRKNICYSLQCLDLNSFFINRFYIGLSAGKIFLKLGMLNIFSIIEGILFGTAKELHSFCMKDGTVCKKNINCFFYIKSSNKYKFETLIHDYENKDLLNLSDNGKELLKIFKVTRDKIHLQDVVESELNENYSIDNYNSMVKFLIYLRENFSGNVSRFEQKRKNSCLNNG